MSDVQRPRCEPCGKVAWETMDEAAAAVARTRAADKPVACPHGNGFHAVSIRRQKAQPGKRNPNPPAKRHPPNLSMEELEAWAREQRGVD